MSNMVADPNENEEIVINTREELLQKAISMTFHNDDIGLIAKRVIEGMEFKEEDEIILDLPTSTTSHPVAQSITDKYYKPLMISLSRSEASCV